MPNKKASILIMSVIITGMIIMIALSISLGSIRNRKASIGASGTTAAFQKAETGIERVLDIIRNNQDKSKISGEGGGIDWETYYFSCEDQGNYATLVSSYGYKVQLKGESDAIVTHCASTALSAIKNIKSIGTAEGSQRAIEAAMAAGMDWHDMESFSGDWGNYNDGIKPSPATNYQKVQCAVDQVKGLGYLRGMVEADDNPPGVSMFSLPSACKPPIGTAPRRGYTVPVYLASPTNAISTCSAIVEYRSTGTAFNFISDMTSNCPGWATASTRLISLDGISYSLD